MSKKLFLQRNTTPNGSTSKNAYIKVLFWAAVALVLLMIIAPLMTRQKEPGKPPGAEKASPERGGIVLREMPRTPVPVQEEGPNPPAEDHPSDLAKESRPEAVTDLKGFLETPAGRPFASGAQPAPEPPQKAPDNHLTKIEPPHGQTPGAQQLPPEAKPPESAPQEKGVIPPKKPAAPEKSVAVRKPKAALPGETVDKKTLKPSVQDDAAADARPAGSPEAPKPSGKGMYTVQVGSFKEKANAEEMQQNLQKRGYSVMIKTHVRPEIGQLYVVQLQPVPDERKASTLAVQIKNEARVKPMVVKLPAE